MFLKKHKCFTFFKLVSDQLNRINSKKLLVWENSTRNFIMLWQPSHMEVSDQLKLIYLEREKKFALTTFTVVWSTEKNLVGKRKIYFCSFDNLHTWRCLINWKKFSWKEKKNIFVLLTTFTHGGVWSTEKNLVGKRKKIFLFFWQPSHMEVSDQLKKI